MLDWIIMAATIVAATLMGAVMPFMLGFAAQSAWRRRDLPMIVVTALALVVVLPTWLWGVGLQIDIFGPRVLGHVAEFVFALVCLRFGSELARKRHMARQGGPERPAEA